jgi:hypothetical protein
MFSLAAQAGCHPWFISSMFSLDPMTDFWPSFAAYVKANSPGWMVPRYEGVNEQWNFATGFWGTRYGWNKAWVHWGTSQFGVHQWQGKILSTLGQAINSAYGGLPNGTKYWLVNGVQNAPYGTTASVITSFNERLTSASYVGQATAAQVGYVKAAASLYTTHVCPAQYFSPTAYNTLSELQTAIRYSAVHLTSTASQAADLNTYADTLIGSSTSGASILTLASPGTLTWAGHGLSTGNTIILYTTGTLPTGLSERVIYWVTVVDANTLNLSASSGGTKINFTGSQSGIHTVVVTDVTKSDMTLQAANMQAFATWAAGFTNNASLPIGVTAYEGGWGPALNASGASDASASVTTISAPGPNPQVTVGANTTLSSGSSVSGVGAIVGGAVSFTGVGGMTQLNTVTFAPSFVGGGSANIGGANSMLLNQAVSFLQTSGTAYTVPSEIVAGAPYYVVSAGNPFQISKTRGGTPLTFAGAMSFGLSALPGWFVTAVSGNQITLDVDATGFGAYTSGGTLSYNRSNQQVNNLRIDGRKATDLLWFVWGNKTPIPSLYLSFQKSGLVFPSKFSMTSDGRDCWGGIQPSIYASTPTTGEWPAMVLFNNNKRRLRILT